MRLTAHNPPLGEGWGETSREHHYNAVVMDDAQPIESTEFRCVQCGYDVSGSAVGGTCPECGKPISESIRFAQPGEEPCGTATASMVLGIISLLVCGMFGPIAIWLYVNAKREMAAGGFSRSAHYQANAGLLMGVASLIVSPILVMIIVSSR